MSRFVVKFRGDQFVALGPRPWSRGFSVARTIDEAYQCSEATAKLIVARNRQHFSDDAFEIVPVPEKK
ncbi:MAG: hypothetical protein WBP38_00410 [Hyphomicrobium sp.]|nr:hypothetical protein [Hyphomicrobium sp.]